MTNPLNEVGNLQVSTSSDPIATTIAPVLPTAPEGVHASYGGSNTATVSWDVASEPSVVEGYVVSVVGGPNAGEEVAVPGTATAAKVTSLVTGPQTFSVLAFGTFGSGPSSTTTFDVTGASGATYVSTVLGDHPSAFYRLGDTTTDVMADSSGNGADGYYNAANVTENVIPGALAGRPRGPGGVGREPTAVRGHGGTVSPVREQQPHPRGVDEDGHDVVQLSGVLSGVGLRCRRQPRVRRRGGGRRSDRRIGLQRRLRFTTSGPLNNDQWHLIDITYNGSTAVAYVDGQEIGSATLRRVVGHDAFDAAVGRERRPPGYENDGIQPRRSRRLYHRTHGRPDSQATTPRR